jgi:hypothetical protein
MPLLASTGTKDPKASFSTPKPWLRLIRSTPRLHDWTIKEGSE